MIFDILTIFPGIFESPLQESILRRAREKGSIEVHLVNIRDFAADKHAMTDDRPFGGGEGMVMKPEPLTSALKSISHQVSQPSRVVLLSPQGKLFNQKIAREFAAEERIVFVCGRYEGVDKRFCEKYITDEVSIGDYILTGGELAAMVIIDSVTRLLPGVLGCNDSAEKDTFSRNLLKHPQFTRPRNFEGMDVPDVLLGGDHRAIEEYRFLQSVKRTLDRRPELIALETFSKNEIKLLKKNGLYLKILEIQQAGGKS